jgi:hypothetical protein
MPWDRIKPKDELQDLSWRTRELGLDLRRKLFQKVLPQAAPRAKVGDDSKPTSTGSKQTENPSVPRRRRNG